MKDRSLSVTSLSTRFGQGGGGVCHKPSVGTIRQQSELLQHGLADQHLVTLHQSFFERVSPHDRENDRLGYGNNLGSPIGILGYLVAARHEAESLHDIAGMFHRTLPVSTMASAS